MEMIRIAILDDYQNVSLKMADWSPLAGRATITVFNDHLSNFEEIVERLLPSSRGTLPMPCFSRAITTRRSPFTANTGTNR